jgi:hypothetical protein
MYAEELNSAKSSVTLQSTDRHAILGQKSTSFQLSVEERDAEWAPDCPHDGLRQKSCASAPAGERTAGWPSRVVVGVAGAMGAKFTVRRK